MFFSQRITNNTCLSYFYGCLSSAEGVAVDVVEGDEQWFIDESQRRYVSIRYVIDTHIHADHRSGGRNLAKFVHADYALHESAFPLVTFPFLALHDDEILTCGRVQSKVLHTPGHTMESICLEVTDLRRSIHPWFLLTGDTLFIGSVGRADLAGEVQKMAGILFDTLREKFDNREDYLEIWPAHGPGTACGVSEISGKTSSTLGFERVNNPFLNIHDRKEFIDRLIQTTIVQPEHMEEIIRSNRGLPP